MLVRFVLFSERDFKGYERVLLSLTKAGEEEEKDEKERSSRLTRFRDRFKR